MPVLDDNDVQRRLDEALAHRDSVSPEKMILGLMGTFDLATDGQDEFTFPAKETTARERIFGGQVIAQALVAADHTVDDQKSIHSLHSYFLRAGDETKPLHFRVHRDFDGRSISNRRVVVRQDEKVIFNLTASFQKAAEGLAHQTDLPDLLPPEDCVGDMEAIARNPQIADENIKRMSNPWPFEMRRHREKDGSSGSRQYEWLKAVAPLPDDPLMHRAALGFASDMGLLSTSMIPHNLHWSTPGMFTTSLDHAMWFHDDFRVDEWFVYVMDCDWTGHARGLNRGTIYTQDGRMIASAVQEGMIRFNPPTEQI
jgi:acyl-CoA thioesterase II